MKGGLRGIIIDGFLVVYSATCNAILAFIVTETTFKYVDPKTVWKFELFLLATAQAANSLKSFRSTAFAHHLDEVKIKEDKQEVKEDKAASEGKTVQGNPPYPP